MPSRGLRRVEDVIVFRLPTFFFICHFFSFFVCFCLRDFSFTSGSVVEWMDDMRSCRSFSCLDGVRRNSEKCLL